MDFLSILLFLNAFYFNTPSTLQLSLFFWDKSVHFGPDWKNLSNGLRLTFVRILFSLTIPWFTLLRHHEVDICGSKWNISTTVTNCHQNVVHILSAVKIISADIHLLTSGVWKRARKSLQTPHTLEITRSNALWQLQTGNVCYIHRTREQLLSNLIATINIGQIHFCKPLVAILRFLKVKCIDLSFDNTVFRKTPCFGSKYLVLSAQTQLENIMASCWKYPVVSPIQIVKTPSWTVVFGLIVPPDLTGPPVKINVEM